MRFKIALPGFDIKDSNVGDETIDSLYPSPKIDTTVQPPHTGLIFLNWNSATETQARDTTRLLYSFPHGYNYIPTAFGTYSFDNGTLKDVGVLPFFIGALGTVLIDTDATNVNLKYFSFDIVGGVSIPPFTMQIRFYVMVERGYE